MKQSRKIKTYINNTIIKYTSLLILVFFILYIGSLLLIFNLSIMNPNNKNNEIVANQISWELSTLRNEISELSKSSLIASTLQSKQFLTETNQLLFDLNNDTKLSTHFILMGRNGEIVSSDLYEGQRSYLKNSFFLRNIQEEIITRGFIENSYNSLFLDSPNSTYYLATSIQDGENLVGYLLFFVKEFSVFHTHNQMVYVVDRFDNVLTSTNELWRGPLGKLNIDQQKRFHAADGNNFYVSSKQLKASQISVITLASVNIYKSLLLYGAIFMAISGSIVALSTLIITPKILNNTLKPFDALVSYMKNENSNKSLPLNDQVIEEFQTIYEEYSNKITEITQLIETNRDIVDKKKSFEIKHLESKFNPHFLYNALEMLKYEILFDPENASEIVVKIANLMRYKVNTEDAVVPLRTDVNYLEDYFALQKMRFGERLSLKINIEANVNNPFVPKLIIQPLVENAIKHNIEVVGHLLIEMTVKKMEDYIYIEVRDNGRGLSIDKLKQIKKRLLEKGELGEHNGLRNTHSIIQLLYGTGFGLDITSQINHGTKVWVTLPAMEGDCDD